MGLGKKSDAANILMNYKNPTAASSSISKVWIDVDMWNS